MNKKMDLYIALEAGIEVIRVYAKSFDDVQETLEIEKYCYDEIINISEQIDDISIGR